MYKNLKWLRLVPDKPGKGGQKTGYHSFQAQPFNDTRVVRGFHVYRGRWRQDYAAQLIVPQDPQFGAGIESLSLHCYSYPNLTDPSAKPSTTLLGHHLLAGVNHIWDFSTATSRYIHVANAVPATFLNIGGRCFAADGGREGMVMDFRVPAIHAQQNQNLGVGTPTQALPTSDYASPALTGNISPFGTAYIHQNSWYINHPNPDNKIGQILITDFVTVTVLNPNATAYYFPPGLVGIVPDVPTVAGVSSNTTPFTAAGTISVTQGESIVVLAGATWPDDYRYAGLSINFNGYSFVILTHGWTAIPLNLVDINGQNIALNDTDLLILGVYDGPTILNSPYTITGCQVTMDPAHPSTLTTVNSNPAAAPAGVALGYGQSTDAWLVQVKILAEMDGAGGLYRNLGNISLGDENTDPPTMAAIRTVADIDMKYGSRSISSVSASFVESDTGSPIFIDEASSTGGVLDTTIEKFWDATHIQVIAFNTSGADIVGGQAWWGSGPIISDGGMAIGDKTLTSASTPFLLSDVGKTIVVEFAGDALGTTALITTVASYTNPGSIELTDPNLNAVIVAAARVWWRTISTSVHAGPTYAYAWYDPETGHMSNISPMYQVQKPLDIGMYADFANITPFFQIDEGYISYLERVADGIRFSHLMFFRTLSPPGNSTLYPIGSLQPYVGKVHPAATATRGSWNPSTYHGWMGLPNNYITAFLPVPAALPNYWFDFSSDADLLLSGGFRAPQYTNEKPMVTLRGGITEPGKVVYQAYWDRRLWVVNVQEPDKVAFSCDEAQCPLGIPVESFPPTNYLRIPGVDGRVVGMKMVGEMLLITTDRWAYTVAGNNETNYRLLRISTRMEGVGTYQISEMTSDVEGQAAIVYFLGRDNIVYEWVPGGQINAISDPIQNTINSRISTLQEYQRARVHAVSAWSRRLVVLSFGSDPTTGISCLIFDAANRVWTENWTNTLDGLTTELGPATMTTIYGQDPPVNEIFAAPDSTFGGIYIWSWLRDDGPVQTLAPVGYDFSIVTFPLNFDGLKTRKQLAMVNIHVSADNSPHAAGGNYICAVAVNEAAIPVVTTLTPFSNDPLYSIYAATSLPVDSPLAADIVALTGQFTADNSALVGYRFVVEMKSISTAAPTEVYAIDIGYTEWAEPGEGDP